MAANYVEIFTRIWETFYVQWKYRGPSDTFFKDFIDDLSKYSFIKGEDVIITMVLGVAFTIARYVSTSFVFKPVANYFQFIAKDRSKFPESAWKLLYYTSSYSYCCYLLYNGKYSFIEDPDSVWKELEEANCDTFLTKVPSDIYILYAVQSGFYFHSIYGTFFMDKWRKDSIVMILHHVLTICLLAFSFTSRYHNIGLVVLYLHDVADVFLEFTKICVCFKSRPGHHRIADRLVTFGFLMFAFVWAKCRLYQYPYRVLYVTGYSSMQMVPDGKFYLFFNAMLWMLFIMNIYWFHFVLWLIWRVWNGESREVEDVRELSKEETFSLKREEAVIKNGKPQSQSFHSLPEENHESEVKNGIKNKTKKNGIPHQRRKKNLQGTN